MGHPKDEGKAIDAAYEEPSDVVYVETGLTLQQLEELESFRWHDGGELLVSAHKPHLRSFRETNWLRKPERK